MLTYDPVPWLMKQEGTSAVRARRSLGLNREDDVEASKVLEEGISRSQLPDGSFDSSPMKTAGILNLLRDMQARGSDVVMERASTYLMSVLQSQPGYGQAESILPGTLDSPCDLGGFFGPFEDRDLPEVMVNGAKEMNFYREYEPLLGPKSPVRSVRRSNLDRAAGPGSCYSWGLLPLSYTVEAVCRGGFHADPRLKPAVNALLGAQDRSGGWCRNPGGGFSCTIPAIRALGSHPELRAGREAEAALHYLRAHRSRSESKAGSRWRGSNLFSALEATARFSSPAAKEIIADALSVVTQQQRRNGTFGTPFPIERVAAVIAASRTLES